MTGRFDLQRFVQAQDSVFSDVLEELRLGRKASHWMWFIFPQIRGLGSSSTAKTFAIQSLEEAQAYLAHPVLGPRLLECTKLVLESKASTPDQIFGYPDNLKFRSSMTLFAAAAAKQRTDVNSVVFQQALDRFYGGQGDQATLTLI